MNAVPTLVLPGLDGTGALLSRFRRLAPVTHSVSVLDLPTNVKNTYETLARSVWQTVSNVKNCVLVGESFSGPLAVCLAARHPNRIAALVLVASFVTPPILRIAGVIPWSLAFRLPVPGFLLRRFMLGPDCQPTLVRSLKSVARSVSPIVLAQRLRQIIRVDMTEELTRVVCPIMYLRPSRDRLIPRRCVQKITSLRPDTQVTTMDGPHLILQTQPSEAWRHIADFTSNNPAG